MIGDINRLDRAQFVERLGGVFEHSPWVAEGAWARRPFASVGHLHEAMMAVAREAPEARRVALVRAHPELAGAEAKAGALTADSSSEQARLGLTRLPREALQRMSGINRAYRQKFGFPCIVALRLHATRESVIAEMERRLMNDRQVELLNALDEIGHITRGRLERILA